MLSIDLRFISLGSALKKAKSVARTDTASRFGREVFDVREMIVIQLIGQIIGAQTENMRVMLGSVSVRSVDVE